MQVQRVRELELKFKSVRLPIAVEAQILSPREAADVGRRLIAESPVERVIALHLNAKRRLIGVHPFSLGTVNSALVIPRDVLIGALLSNAASVIVIHNHPSGDPTPSLEDIELTRRLAQAAELVGVPLDDAIIVGEEGRYFSLREAGRLA